MPDESLRKLFPGLVHDLRAQLRTISMQTQRLQRANPDEATASKLASILTAAKRQDELLHSAGEFVQSLEEAPDLLLHLPIKLGLQNACMKVESLRTQLGGTIEVSIEDGLRGKMSPDFVKALEKVLENALRFGGQPGKPPEVRVTASKGEQDGAQVLVVLVEDCGPGIPGEYRDRVFEPFFRLAYTAADGPRSGLGLSICRQLMHRAEGSVSFEDCGESESGTKCRLAAPLYDLD